MRSRLAFISLAVISALALFLGTVHGQRVNPRKRNAASSQAPKLPAPVLKSAGILAAKQRMVANALDQASPTWNVYVAWNLSLNANAQALYQQMATVLGTATAVPNDRLNYYSAFNTPDWAIGGWNGMITNVQPAAGGGYLVTASVQPVFTNYTSISIISDYSEQYTINQGTVNYVGFLDPNNWAGTLQGMANK